MINYSDLSESQQEAVDDALELKTGYDSLELEPVEDPREAVKYKNFRRELEGLEVERGEMSEEQLEGYLRAGILQEDGEGLEINSVWLPGHIETLEENGMIDLDFDDLYVARDEERGIEKAVYGDEAGYHSNARHGGGLRFRFDENVENEIEGEGRSDQQIGIMVAEMVAEGREELGEEFIENFDIDEFMPENSNKQLSQADSDKTNKALTLNDSIGGNNMTDDYDQGLELLREHYEAGRVPTEIALSGVREDFPEDPNLYDTLNAAEIIYDVAHSEAEEAESTSDSWESIIDNLVDDSEAALAGYGRTIASALELKEELEATSEGLYTAFMSYMEERMERDKEMLENLEEAVDSFEDYTDRAEEISDNLERISGVNIEPSEDQEQREAELQELRDKTDLV